MPPNHRQSYKQSQYSPRKTDHDQHNIWQAVIFHIMYPAIMTYHTIWWRRLFYPYRYCIWVCLIVHPRSLFVTWPCYVGLCVWRVCDVCVWRVCTWHSAFSAALNKSYLIYVTSSSSSSVSGGAQVHVQSIWHICGLTCRARGTYVA